jgi:WD40 repeat protein
VIQRQNFAIHIWDVPSRTEKAVSRPVPADFGGFIALSPDGTVLATTPLPGKRIRLWDTRTLKELPPLLQQPNETVQPMTFSPDGKTLAATYAGPIARLWDLTTRKEKHRIKASFQIYHTSFSADGKTLACAEHGSIRLWDVDKGEFRRAHQFGHTYGIDALHFSPDGKRLVSGAGYTDNIVRIWDPLTGEETGQLRGHAEGIESVAYAPDGKLIASGSQDGSVRLWDAATGREVRRLDAKAGMVYALAFAPDGKTIASGDWRNGIHLWDVATGQKLRSFKNPGGVITRLVLSPDGKTIVTRGGDIRLWDAAKGEIIRRLMGMAAGWPSLALSPDGETLAAGSDDGVVRLWDVNSGAERPALAVPLRDGEIKRVFSVAFSPDGRSLAVGYGEGDPTIRLWELSSGRERACYKGHKGGITSMAFSPDGTLLASGAPDKTILVWDVTGQRTTGRRKANLTTGELTALWSDLGGADAAKAYQAVQTLLGANEQTVPFLRAHLHPAVALDIDKRRIARLIANLDSEEFAERERAMKELRRLGERAAPALREARQGKLPLEARKRVEELLDGVRASAASPQLLRELRAIEVLEHIGTSEARQVLASLAKGDSEARLTREAKVSLERLSKRHKSNP